jgi:hypothetical protein
MTRMCDRGYILYTGCYRYTMVYAIIIRAKPRCYIGPSSKWTLWFPLWYRYNSSARETSIMICESTSKTRHVYNNIGMFTFQNVCPPQYESCIIFYSSRIESLINQMYCIHNKRVVSVIYVII